MENDLHDAFRYRARSPLPTVDGFLFIELSTQPIPYHIAYCYAGVVDQELCHMLARQSCRIACMAKDVTRGRLPRSKLRRFVTPQCSARLLTMSDLIGRDADQAGGQLGLPVIPQMVSGMMITPERIESAVHLTVGADHHWVNLSMRYIGSRWLCDMADVG